MNVHVHNYIIHIEKLKISTCDQVNLAQMNLK